MHYVSFKRGCDASIYAFFTFLFLRKKSENLFYFFNIILVPQRKETFYMYPNFDLAFRFLRKKVKINFSFCNINVDSISKY